MRLRKYVLGLMRKKAEYADRNYYFSQSKEVRHQNYPNGMLYSFKPGVGDRLLFNEMLTNNYPDSVLNGEDSDIIMMPIIAKLVLMKMGTDYYKRYNWWDKKQLEEARRE